MIIADAHSRLSRIESVDNDPPESGAFADIRKIHDNRFFHNRFGMDRHPRPRIDRLLQPPPITVPALMTES